MMFIGSSFCRFYLPVFNQVNSIYFPSPQKFSVTRKGFKQRWFKIYGINDDCRQSPEQGAVHKLPLSRNDSETLPRVTISTWFFPLFSGRWVVISLLAFPVRQVLQPFYSAILGSEYCRIQVLLSFPTWSCNMVNWNMASFNSLLPDSSSG